MEMNQISQIRLINQKIENTSFQSPKEIVKWMGAMQAQDFGMARMAVGCRLNSVKEKNVTEAYNCGEIIRTHVLRPTWHLVSPEDIGWMLDLTSKRIKSSMKSRNRDLELTPAVFNKSNHLLEKLLANNNFLTRDELFTEYDKIKIKTDENRLSHLLMEAELDQLICSGPLKNNKPSYALLTERVSHIKRLSKDESLAKLAKRYFTSRGPATLMDFVWWSGLSVAEARQALEFVKKYLISDTVGAEEYWFSNIAPEKIFRQNSIHLLPAFDEFLIAYRDRSASINQQDNPKAISNNGIFWPILVINGKVAGSWKRTIKKERLLVEIKSFSKIQNVQKPGIEKEAHKLGNFLEKEVELLYN
ncbi:MAG: winged helix DNA-binding domain-containing protein [Bacteroidales bacterium]